MTDRQTKKADIFFNLFFNFFFRVLILYFTDHSFYFSPVEKKDQKCVNNLYEEDDVEKEKPIAIIETHI